MTDDRDSMNDQAPGGGWRELAAVAIAAAILAVVLTYPFARQMTHVGRVDTTDGEWSIWVVSWVARALVADPAHVLDANIFYPHRGTLLYSETNLGAGALAIPAYWATRNPIFTLNFVFLLSLVLGAAGAYYLVRYLVGDRRAAAVAGICFGFCPFVFGRTPHVQLFITAGLPFSMLAFHRVVDHPSLRRSTTLGVAVAIQALFCGYYAVFVVLMLGYATLVTAVLRGVWRNRRFWGAMAWAGAVAVVAVLPLAIAYVRFMHATGFHRDLSEAARYSADWRAYFASNGVAHVWMLSLLEHWNEVLFPGFVALAGGAAGFGLTWTLRGRLREAAIVYGSLAVLACWASFGPSAVLYSALYRIVPLFTLMRAPARFGIVVTLGLVVLTGIAVRVLLGRVARPNVVAALLVVLAAADVFVPLKFPEVPRLSPGYAALRRVPPGPVIELPFFSNPSRLHGHARYMRYSTAHWLPLINGYSDYIPQDFRRNAETLRGFPSREAFRLLEPTRARYAVFHMQTYGPEERAQVIARLREFEWLLRPLYIGNDTRVYAIEGFRVPADQN